MKLIYFNKITIVIITLVIVIITTIAIIIIMTTKIIIIIIILMSSDNSDNSTSHDDSGLYGIPWWRERTPYDIHNCGGLCEENLQHDEGERSRNRMHSPGIEVGSDQTEVSEWTANVWGSNVGKEGVSYGWNE